MSNGGGTSTNSSGSSTTINSLPDWLTNAYQSNLGTSQGLYGAEGANNGMSVANQGAGLSSLAGANPQSIGTADSTLSSILGGGYNGNATNAYNASNPLLSQEASGSLMSQQNPYLGAEYNQGLQGIQNNVDSQFGAAGRNVLGGAPVQSDQASNLATDLYGGAYSTNLGATQNAQGLVSGNYNTGVNAIGQAAATAPSVTSGLYTQGNNLLNSGATANNNASWYQQLLGQSALPFGQSTNTGNSSNRTSNSLGTISTIGGILGLI